MDEQKRESYFCFSCDAGPYTEKEIKKFVGGVCDWCSNLKRNMMKGMKTNEPSTII
jgi:hypothetical protein